MKWQAFIGRWLICLIGMSAVLVGYSMLRRWMGWPFVTYPQTLCVVAQLSINLGLLLFAAYGGGPSK